MTVIIIVIGIVVGILIGNQIPFIFSGGVSVYVSVAIMAVIDSLFGAMRAYFEDKFNMFIFSSGLIANTLLAVLLAYAGDKLGIPLYYAALFAFGTRMFQNMGAIRRLLLSKWIK